MSESGEHAEHQVAGPSLTKRDHELVRLQCELQHATSPEQIQGMTDAFRSAKQLAYQHRDVPMSAEQVQDFVLEMAATLEPRNGVGWRSVPAVFASGESGERPDNIGAAMAAWAQAYAEDRFEATEGYYQFERIHPFEDGNGRLGHCLWAIATYRVFGVWPTELPPDLFSGTDHIQPQTHSAFGDIEPGSH